MKSKIVLISLLVCLLAGKSFSQQTTLGLAFVPLPATAAPGTPFAVTLTYAIGTNPASNVVITCNIPSGLQYVSGGGPVFNIGNVSGSTSSTVSFMVKFPVGTTCPGSAQFTATITASNAVTSPVTATSSVVAANVTAAGSTNWFYDEYHDGGYGISNTSTNPTLLNYYVNPACVNNCDDTIILLVGVDYNGSTLNLKTPKFKQTLPAGVTFIGAGAFTNAACTVPASVTTSTSNSVEFDIGNLTNHSLEVSTHYYYYYIKIRIAHAFFNQTLDLTSFLSGNNFCDNSAYTYPAVPPLHKYIKIVPQIPGACGVGFTTTHYNNNGNAIYPIGCDYSVCYSFTDNNQCRLGCPDNFTNISMQTTIPNQIQVNSITLPVIQTGQQVALTVHYKCGTNTTVQTYGPVTYTQPNTGAIIPVSTICTACGSNPIYVTDYGYTSNINLPAMIGSPPVLNLTENFGCAKFTLLDKEWPALTVPVTNLTAVTVPVIYTSQNGQPPFSCDKSFLPSVDTVVKVYKQVCNPKTCYNIGDTVDYVISFQNTGTSNFLGGTLRDILPPGVEYVANSATYSRFTPPHLYYENYCSITGNPVTDITPQFQANTNVSTPLVWNLPLLTTQCNGPGDIFVVKFKGRVNNTAVFGTTTNTAQILNSAGTVKSYYTADIRICLDDPELKPVKEVSADNINWSNNVTVPPGSTVYYKLTLKNTGTVPLSQIHIMDLLPAIGDKNVMNCNPRNSTMNIYLTSVLSGLPALVTDKYNLDQSPVRGTFLNFTPDFTTVGGPPAPCGSSGPWQIPSYWNSTSIQNVHSFQLDYGTTILAPGATQVYQYSAMVPPGAAVGSIGHNSFGVTAYHNGVSTYQSSGTESQKVTVTVGNVTCQCIGNFVWLDANANGLQDAGEPGMNGVTLTLYNASTNTAVGLPHISTFNASGAAGYYQFCNLPAGSYYILVTPPATYQVGPQAASSSSPALNNDADPSTQKSTVFTVNCNQQNNDIDFGIVPDDGCKCDGSSWGSISYSYSSIINPHVLTQADTKTITIPANGKEKERTVTIINSSDDPVPSGNKSFGNTGNGQAGPWTPIYTTITVPLTCTKPYNSNPNPVTLVCGTTYSFNATYNCSKQGCGKVTSILTYPNGTVQNGNGAISFAATEGGFYSIKIYGYCGFKLCDSCLFVFKVQCPVCPCPYNLAVSPKTPVLTAYSNSRYAFNTADIPYTITAPSAPIFTEVTATVTNIVLSSANGTECLTCKYLPFTWGSVKGGSLGNLKDTIRLMDNATTTHFNPPTSGSLKDNPRQIVFNNGGNLFAIPQQMNLHLYLPPASTLSCCELSARVCIRFTFRDANCKECTVNDCITIKIPPIQALPVLGDNPAQK